jgi:hypothetical protein
LLKFRLESIKEINIYLRFSTPKTANLSWTNPSADFNMPKKDIHMLFGCVLIIFPKKIVSAKG